LINYVVYNITWFNLVKTATKAKQAYKEAHLLLRTFIFPLFRLVPSGIIERLVLA